MSLNWFMPILALGASPDGQQSTWPLWGQLPMFALLFVIFYFALIRPQQRKTKEHEQLVKGLGKGDKVVTSGGLVGTIVSVKERTVTLRSDDAKLEILKSAVSEVTERAVENKV